MKKIISLIIVMINMIVPFEIPTELKVPDFIQISETPEMSLESKETFELSQNAMRTSMGDFGISYVLHGNELTVIGKVEDPEAKYALLVFTNTEENKKIATIMNGCFKVTTNIPKEGDVFSAELYLGPSWYGEFDSLVYDFVKMQKANDEWVFVDAPTLEENMTIFNKPKDLDKALQCTKNIPSNDDEIQTLSNEITKDCQDDYEKVLKIHDWIAENIYYNYDAFYSGDYGSADALDVLHSKCGVCEGYANLFAALVRAQNIPCRVQQGVALGIGTEPVWSEETLSLAKSNHAWNEAYVGDRWMIIDATWDSNNKMENGQMIKGDSVNHIYFDADMKFFSLSHRSME